MFGAFIVGSNFSAITEANSTELAIPLPITVLARVIMANSPWVMVAQGYHHGIAFEKIFSEMHTYFLYLPSLAVPDAH